MTFLSDGTSSFSSQWWLCFKTPFGTPGVPQITLQSFFTAGRDSHYKKTSHGTNYLISAQVTRLGGLVSQLWFDPLHPRILPRCLHPQQKPQRGDADVHVSCQYFLFTNFLDLKHHTFLILSWHKKTSHSNYIFLQRFHGTGYRHESNCASEPRSEFAGINICIFSI